MPKSPILYVVRHGSTKLNSQDRFRGPLDIPLDAEGEKQAVEVGRQLSGAGIAGIIHTGRDRAFRTASLMRKVLNNPNVPVSTDTRLQAWNVGVLAGMEKNDENVKWLQGFIDNPNLVIPGGESLMAFRQRVQPALSTAIRSAQKVGSPLALVVHSSVLHELGNMLNGDTTAALVEPGGISGVFDQGDRLTAQGLTKMRSNTKGGLAS